MTIPKEQKASVIQEGQTLKIETIAVPLLAGEHEILIKNEAAAQNPTDWKHLKFKLAGPGKVLGCDLAGTIVSAKDKSLIGKRVAAVVHGGWELGNGAFQEYVKIDGRLTIPLPSDVSFEDGATLPLPTITAAMILFQQHKFPFPGEGSRHVPFLVWGGASSVGMYAIQLANLAGATVIATASKNNHELLKSLGAKYTFDYNDPHVVDQIKSVSDGGVEFGIDCVSIPETVGQASKAFVANGKIGLILPVDKSKSGDHLEHRNILMYTIFNHEFSMGAKMKGSHEDREFATKAYKVIGELLASGKLKPNPIKKYSKGLAGIPRGFEDMEADKIRAEKIVYTISETP